MLKPIITWGWLWPTRGAPRRQSTITRRRCDGSRRMLRRTITWGLPWPIRGAPTEAIYHYSEALRLRPSYARAHYNLGNVLNRQGKIQEAIQQYTEALRLQPNLAEAHHNLGATLADAGHIAE